MDARQEFEAKIINRATTDSAFRALLLEDPLGAIQTISGPPPPPNLEIFVHEERATSIHLVLPDKGRLAEEDLTFAGAGEYPDNQQYQDTTNLSNWLSNFQ